MARVWEHSTHSGTHLLMMLAIADFADDDGRAYPSVSTLAKKCRTTPRNVNLILAALKASGELGVLANQGPKGTNVYRVRLTTQGVKESSGVKKPSGVKAPSSTPEEAFLPPCRGLLETPEEAFSQTITEPSVNHQEPPKGEKQRRKGKPALLPLPEGFNVSPQVEAWAQEHGHTRLPERLEHFTLKAQAQGYQYADWDAAFMNAIRDDWAKLNGAAGRRHVNVVHTGFETIDYSEGIGDDGRIT